MGIIRNGRVRMRKRDRERIVGRRHSRGNRKEGVRSRRQNRKRKNGFMKRNISRNKNMVSLQV